MFDIACPSCEYKQIDVMQPSTHEQAPCPECGTTLVRAWFGKGSGVIGDECDLWIRHGICNLDGTPRHYRSKAEMKRVAVERGQSNHVEHIGARGSDKSKHTTRWI